MINNPTHLPIPLFVPAFYKHKIRVDKSVRAIRPHWRLIFYAKVIVGANDFRVVARDYAAVFHYCSVDCAS